MYPKKIAIISDIHANIYALNAFLEYINQDSNVEVVFNLGDFISDGPNPCEVFDTIIQDKRFINILGKNECEIIERVELSVKKEEVSGQFDANDGRCVQDWLIERLGKNRINKLKELKSLREVEILGKKILLTYSKFGDSLGVVEKSLIASLYNDENIKKIDKEKFFAFDYIFYGGSHFQQFNSCDVPPISFKIIDPGALCCLKSNLAGFAIISFDGVNENISLRSIEFDLNRLIEDLYKFKVPAKEAILYSKYKISDIEDVLEKSEDLKKYILYTGNLYIGWNKHGKDGNPIVNKEILIEIIKICLKRSKFITFGCWNNEKLVIDEILNTMDIVKKETSDFNGQIWFKGEITEKVITLITENIIDINGRVKWFDFSLQDSLSIETNQFILAIEHYANEIYLNNVAKEDLIEIKSILNTDEVYYRVSPLN